MSFEFVHLYFSCSLALQLIKNKKKIKEIYHKTREKNVKVLKGFSIHLGALKLEIGCYLVSYPGHIQDWTY